MEKPEYRIIVKLDIAYSGKKVSTGYPLVERIRQAADRAIEEHNNKLNTDYELVDHVVRNCKKSEVVDDDITDE